MLNQIILVGRLTDNPKPIYDDRGELRLVGFTLAVGRNYKSSDGVEADFIRCKAYGKLGETCSKYLQKGFLTNVVGELRVNGVKDEEGNYKEYINVVVRELNFLPNESVKNQVNNNSQGYAPQGYNTSQYSSNQPVSTTNPFKGASAQEQVNDIREQYNNPYGSRNFEINENDLPF